MYKTFIVLQRVCQVMLSACACDLILPEKIQDRAWNGNAWMPYVVYSFRAHTNRLSVAHIDI